MDFELGLTPPNKLIHKGVFSPDLNEYYYTISDPNFDRMDQAIILSGVLLLFQTAASDRGLPSHPIK